MKFTRSDGQYGSVTVILTMVLVPMVVIAGIFVDGGRALLAQSVVLSTEQLALNDVLAQNDADLQQLFGLLGVIDSEDLDAQALEIMQVSLGGSPDAVGGDILQIGLSAPGAGGIVSPVENANLAQPEVLANQIVEFMKYRAPVKFAAELLESITWLTTMQTNMEMIRKKVAYLNEITKVIDEATELLAKIDEITTAVDNLISAANDLSTLNSVDPIHSIYSDALNQLIAERDDESEDEFTTEEKALLDGRLKSATDAIIKIQTTATALEASLSGFSTTALTDAIAALTDDGEAYREAVAVQELATSPDDGDVVASKKELAGYDLAVANVLAAIEDAGDTLVADVQGIATDFVADSLASLGVSSDEFATWGTYDGLSAFVNDYLSTNVATLNLSAEDAISELKVALSLSLQTVVASVGKELSAAATNGITTVLKDLKDSLGAFVGNPLGNQSAVSIADFFKVLETRLDEYRALIDALTQEKASPYLTGGTQASSDIGTDRPSSLEPKVQPVTTVPAGAMGDTNQLASGSDELFASIGSVLGSLKDSLANVYDSILIAEYIVGQFTYSSLSDPGERLTGEPRCADVECAAEAEYVLTGENSPAKTYGMVFLIRLAANLVTAFRDPSVGVIRSAVFSIPFVGPALSFVVPIVAAIVQSVDDLSKLANGEAVRLYSTQLSTLSIGGVVSDLVETTLPDFDLEGNGSGAGDSDDKGMELTYAHYLEIFLIFGLVVNRDAMVKRTGDIIQFNIAGGGRADFRLAQAGTAYSVSAEYRVKPLVSSFFSFEDAGGGLFEGANGLHRLTSVGGY